MFLMFPKKRKPFLFRLKFSFSMFFSFLFYYRRTLKRKLPIAVLYGIWEAYATFSISNKYIFNNKKMSFLHEHSKMNLYFSLSNFFSIPHPHSFYKFVSVCIWIYCLTLLYELLRKIFIYIFLCSNSFFKTHNIFFPQMSLVYMFDFILFALLTKK